MSNVRSNVRSVFSDKVSFFSDNFVTYLSLRSPGFNTGTPKETEGISNVRSVFWDKVSFFSDKKFKQKFDASSKRASSKAAFEAFQ
jgi:hypothetical protein